MNPPSTIARGRVASKLAEGGILDFDAAQALYRDPTRSAQPADSVVPEAIGNRFPRWPNREAGTAEAAIEWS